MRGRVRYADVNMLSRYRKIRKGDLPGNPLIMERGMIFALIPPPAFFFSYLLFRFSDLDLRLISAP